MNPLPDETTRDAAESAAMVWKPKLLYTPQEAAARLGVPVTWIYQRTRTNALPFRKLGKYVRFSESDLLAIIEQMEAGRQ